MKRYIRTSTLLNIPDSYNINGMKELKDAVGTRSQIYSLISEYNPLAIIDKRQSFVSIDGVHYLIILKKCEGGYQIRCIWKLDEPSGQYFLQDDTYRPL